MTTVWASAIVDKDFSKLYAVGSVDEAFKSGIFRNYQIIEKALCNCLFLLCLPALFEVATMRNFGNDYECKHPQPFSMGDKKILVCNCRIHYCSLQTPMDPSTHRRPSIQIAPDKSAPEKLAPPIWAPFKLAFLKVV